MKTKKQFTNRILSLVLALVMVLGMLPMTAYAATSGSCGDGVYFTINNGTLTITGSGAVMKEARYECWNDECNSITKIVIQNGVTLPNASSLSGHINLTTVEYGDTVATIWGNLAFRGCLSLSSFTLREGVGQSNNGFASCRNLNGTGVKLVDASGNDKTSFYTVSVEWNTSNKNFMTVKGNLAKGSVAGIPDQQYTGEGITPAVTVTWNGQTVSSDNYDIAYSNNIEPGTATVTVTGKDAKYYTGTLTQTFTILEPQEMTGVSAQNVTATYDGNAHGISVTGAPADATITYSSTQDGTYTEMQPAIVNVADSGTVYYKVTAQGYKEFNGSASVTISPRNIADCLVQDIAAQTYTGSVIIPDVTVTYENKTLTQNDYSISGDSVNAGEGSVTITGKGNFEGTTTKTFQIKNAYSVSFNANGGTGEKGSVQIMDGEEYTLPANPFIAPNGYQFKGWATSQNGNVLQDETITVSENVTLYAIWEKIPAEMPTVAVSENLTLTYGEYTGQKFTATVDKKDGYTYEYQWIDGSNTVISNTDTLEIPDDLAAGVYDYYLAVGAKRTDNGEITWYSNPNLSVKVNPKELDASNVTLSQNTFTYDGNEQIPTVTVKVGGKTLTENTDYDVILPSDCKNVGKKTITVTFQGNYGGTAQADYEIGEKEIGIYWGATEFIPYTGELIVPQATATGLADGDVCTLTTSVVETTEGAGIVPGRWHAKVTSLSNDNYCLPASGNLVEIDYGIVKGYVDAPVVSGIDETIKGKADGKINGLTTEMEYATEYTADDDKYTKVADANMTFAPGTYYVRYQAAGYYNASSFTEVVIKEGGLLSVTTPQTQTGYTITTADTGLVWNGSTTLSFALKDGYSKTSAFAVKVNGTVVELDANDKYVITNAQENIVITVEGVADITPPTAEITLGTNKWNTFLNNITFGLFFKETQDVTITAADNGSGVNTIQYYLAGGELSKTEVEQITEWEDYNGTFKIDPNNRYVVYVKITDNAGSISYINSDGIVLDNIAPTLEGIENGKTYYGDLTVIKSDEQFYDIKTVTLDGEEIGFAEGTYGLIPADNAEHTVVVEDHAGNKTTYTVTVMKNYTVTYKTDGETVSTETVGHGKDATLPTIPAKEGFVGKWDAEGKNITKDTTISVVYTEIPAVKPDEVKPDDKTDLEDTKAKLEEMLEDDSYTDDDKKDIQDAIDDIDDALEVIGNVEAVKELIDKLPESITKNDEDAIKAADDAYNALSDYEKSLVDEAAKKALTDAKAALAELNKPADTTSPNTGDNSNIWLWVALLFVSGGAVITLTVVDRKKRMASKR